MNYGYAGTREINEALASRFMVINMPVISGEDLKKLLLAQFPDLRDEYAGQFSDLFQELRKKCDSSEISTKALDLRGLLASLGLVKNGLSAGQALRLGIVNKSFDDFERQLVSDLIASRIPTSLTAKDIFAD
jgi:MoxR-like ATPase